MIRGLVAVQFARKVPVRSVERAHPRALDRFDRIGQHHRALFAGFLFDHALFEAEVALRHLVGRLVAGPTEFNRFLEAFRIVVDKVDRALAVAQDVLRRVGRIAAAKQHRVVILACHVVRLHQRIRSQRRTAVLAQRADDDRRHREIQRRLVKVVDDSKVLKAAHFIVPLFPLDLFFICKLHLQFFTDCSRRSLRSTLR